MFKLKQAKQQDLVILNAEQHLKSGGLSRQTTA